MPEPVCRSVSSLPLLSCRWPIPVFTFTFHSSHLPFTPICTPVSISFIPLFCINAALHDDDVWSTVVGTTHALTLWQLFLTLYSPLCTCFYSALSSVVPRHGSEAVAEAVIEVEVEVEVSSDDRYFADSTAAYQCPAYRSTTGWQCR